MSSSRYSTKIHQRDSRTTLFSTGPTDSENSLNSFSSNNLFKSGSEENCSSNIIGNGINNSNLNFNGINGNTSGGGISNDVYNNFGSNSKKYNDDSDDILRSSSPYVDDSKGKDYNATLLSQLESQNEEYYGKMSEKVELLKNLGLRMGTEIKKSHLSLDGLQNDMELGQKRLKMTFNRMLIMAERTGISWKIWVSFFLIIFTLFFWVWLT
ncbi:unnamed protein product [[Candida] boidinii]|nr:unnamed protein product [[Candida] boidinii]